MKIYLDTADIDEIKNGLETGIVDGITTNPSLIKKSQEKHNSDDMRRYIKEILNLAGENKPVSLEVADTSYEGMKNEAYKIYKMFKKHKNLVIKIPINPSSTENGESFDGIKLIKNLASKGISVNTTLIMTPEQAILAAKAGAKYVSPFAGRIDDYIRENKLGMRVGKEFEKDSYFPAEGYKEKGKLVSDNGVLSGVDLVTQIVEIFRTYRFKCEVLAASARNTRQVREFMLAGAHITTIPFSVFSSLTSHYKTVEGINSFTNDTVPEYKELLANNRKFSIHLKKE